MNLRSALLLMILTAIPLTTTAQQAPTCSQAQIDAGDCTADGEANISP